MSEPDDELTRLAEAILEGEPIDWESELARRPDLRTGLERLRRIESVVQVQSGDGEVESGLGFPILTFPRGTEPPESDAPPAGGVTADAPGGRAAAEPLPLARWGDLELRECIAIGGYSEVYRAWDPGLDREVALKLIRPDRPIGAVDQERYLAEARRLARVRHPNVVTVFGADFHEERLGLWMELIEGETFEAILDQRGPFGPTEAAVVAVRVCRALAAVHAAGLVHRDVKAANVMRARGGRIVLLDFGAGAELALDLQRGGPLPEGGTPLILAPELLRGEPATAASDLYAVGALLYRLVTGRYPIEARTIEELATRANQGAWTPLRDLRPDASGACVRVVERALSPEPERRYASAGQMETALQIIPSEVFPRLDDAAGIPGVSAAGAGAPGGAGMPGGAASWPAIPWKPLAIGVAVLAMLAFLAELVARREVPRPPGSTGSVARVPGPLDVRAIFVRERNGQGTFTMDGDTVVPEDGLTLEIEGSDSMHVYVVERTTAGSAFLLFPAPDLDSGNPVPPGTVRRLPGSRHGRSHQWSLGGRPGVATLVTYASRKPIDALEAERQLPDSTGARGLVGDQPVPLRTLETLDATVRSGSGAEFSGSGVGDRGAGEAIWSERIRLRVRGSDGS